MPQSLRVLIADDEPEILLYYRAVLARLGHTVLAEAHNGHEFVEQCRELEPDLVISDIAMPGVDGITALERVRTRSMTPFIFVTGNDNSEIRQRAQHQQVVAYLLKPIRQTDLATVLSRFYQETKKPSTVRWLRDW
jgi:response regulator NasT